MWRQIFQVCFNTVKDNHLVWMQYRILYRILGTNDLLFKIKNHDDGKCCLCKQSTETILHLLVQCENVKKFWYELKAHVHLVLGYELTINPSAIILGNLTPNTNNTPTNTVYLAAKLYIFRTSKSNGILNCVNFCNFLKNIYLEQEYVAKLELKHSNFTKSWG